MSEEEQSQKKCMVEEGNKDDTPKEREGDMENANIAKDNMEGNKRSSPRRKDLKDTGSVVLEKFDLGKKRKSRGDDSSDETEDWVGGKRKLSKRDDEEYIPQSPSKRRRFFRPAHENISSEEISPFKQSKPGKGRKGAKNAGKKNTPKKSRAPKKKAKAQYDDREFEVEKIVKFRVLKNGKKEFLIRWKGFSSEHDTWEPEANVTCKDLVNQYFEEHKEAIDAPDEGDQKSNSGVRKRRGSSGPSRSTKTDSAADMERSEKGNTKKVRGNSKQSLSKGKKKKNRARKAGAKTGKYEAAVTVSKKIGNAGTKKTERGKDKEFSWNLGNFLEAEEKGERRGNCVFEDYKEYEVERIVGVRQTNEGGREFLIKWQGYPNKFNSWESENNMNCNKKIENFLKSMEQTSTERELRVVRKKTNRFVADDGGRGRKMSLRLGNMPRKSYSEID